jgi:uncharacterized protein (TIGR03435 family)
MPRRHLKIDTLKSMQFRQGVFFLIVCALCSAQTQESPHFDAASIKPHKWEGSGGIQISVNGSTLRAEHSDLNMLVEFAYNLRDFQLSGGPDWAKHGKLVESELFQITAKAPEGQQPSMDDMRAMLRTLLADRFHLQVHHVTRQLPAYNLVIAKGGPRLTETTSEEKPGLHIGPKGRGSTTMTATNVTMQDAMRMSLGSYQGRPVYDKTGLTGHYTFTLNWSDSDGGPDGPPQEFPLYSTALQEQLGLKLEPTTAPFDTVVIDHAEKPTEN